MIYVKFILNSHFFNHFFENFLDYFFTFFKQKMSGIPESGKNGFYDITNHVHSLNLFWDLCRIDRKKSKIRN